MNLQKETNNRNEKYSANWNILIAEGKENNKDFVSSGERRRKRSDKKMYMLLI